MKILKLKITVTINFTKNLNIKKIIQNFKRSNKTIAKE